MPSSYLLYHYFVTLMPILPVASILIDPGWPYFLAAIMVALAYQACRALPEDCEDYNPEFYIKTRPSRNGRRNVASSILEEEFGLLDGSGDIHMDNDER